MKKINIWSLLSLLTLLALFAFLINYNIKTFIAEDEKLWIGDLKSLALYDVIFFPLLALAFHIWSIVYLKLHIDAIEKNGVSDCEYCKQTDTGPVLCGRCQSIQWTKLNLLDSIAVFTAQHRWQLLTAFFFLFIATPLSFIYTLKQEKEARMSVKQKEMHETISNVNMVRSLVMKMEASPDINFDFTEYKDFIYRYMQFTWDMSDRLSWLMNVNRLSNKSWDIADTVIQNTLKQRRDDIPHRLQNKDGSLNLINMVTFFVKDDSFDINQTRAFQHYCRSIAAFNRNPANDTLLYERKKAALELIMCLKIVNVIISIISAGPLVNDPVAMKNNQETLDIFCQSDAAEFLKAEPSLNTRELKQTYSVYWPEKLNRFLPSDPPK